eukprot:9386719-Pyramimonas_sp.AAC.2
MPNTCLRNAPPCNTTETLLNIRKRARSNWITPRPRRGGGASSQENAGGNVRGALASALCQERSGNAGSPCPNVA